MKKVSYQGVPGAYSQSAAKKFFGEGIETIGTDSFEDALNSAQEDRTPSDVNYSILPVENSIEGVINRTLDCFVDSPLHICDEAQLAISLFLLAKNTDPKKIKTVYSHPQPLAQSRNWLSFNLPGVEQIPASSTAQAAELAKRDKNSAAIAGQLAAEGHQLKIIAKNIQDRAADSERISEGFRTSRPTR